MSTNNQLVVLKEKDKFELHENFCVDNDFEPSKETLLKSFDVLETAIKYANEYCQEEIVEYGYVIRDECLK